MSAWPNPAEYAFEQHKNDKRVQAILKVLGAMRAHVTHWEMGMTPNRTIKYKVLFRDGSEMRGFITQIPEEYDWEQCQWIASGTLITKEHAKEIRTQEHH